MTQTRQRARTWVAMLVAGVAACGEPGAGPDAEADSSSSTGDHGREHPVDLVWPELWVADPSADLAPTHAPDPVACDVGFDDELGLFEVDTGLCNYGVFSQAMDAEVFVGERVELVFTHDDLTAPEPATGHIAIALGDRIVWEIEVAIPKPYDIVEGEWIADAPIAAGTKVVLHLHNHGYNNWRVISIKTGPP